ncbi:DUF2085 domain-containing protein [Flaviaesturariibacter terrae]
MPAYKIQLVSCHRKPERSFFWKGRQFPVCARCTGIYLGYLTFPFFNFEFWYLASGWALLLMAPTIIDGLTQAYLRRESTNWLRFSTGLAAGTGLMAIVVNIGTFIGNLILT